VEDVNIYVGNLAADVTESDLKQVFQAYGEVSSVRILVDRRSRRSKGFGFVEMKTPLAATAAISGLNRTEMKGRSMDVSEGSSIRGKRSKPHARHRW